MASFHEQMCIRINESMRQQQNGIFTYVDFDDGDEISRTATMVMKFLDYKDQARLKATSDTLRVNVNAFRSKPADCGPRPKGYQYRDPRPPHWLYDDMNMAMSSSATASFEATWVKDPSF